MATDLRSLPNLTSDAAFRAWGSGLAAQFAAVGLVKTANTGQIDWATVVKPASNGLYGGYEIWRFNDALQATKPVFIKVEYGLAGTDQPLLAFSVGTTTNGAGTLGGQTSTSSGSLVRSNQALAAGTLLPSYCSGSASRLSLYTNVQVSNTSLLVLIERTKDAAGVDTGDGYVLLWITYAGTVYQSVPFSGTVPPSIGLNPAASLNGHVSADGLLVALSPTVVTLGKFLFASWCAYVANDFGKLVPVAAQHLGAQHTILGCGDTLNTASVAMGNATGHSMAILWE